MKKLNLSSSYAWFKRHLRKHGETDDKVGEDGISIFNSYYW